MAHNPGRNSGRRYPMEWQAPISGMLKHGTQVRASCHRCSAWTPVDLREVVRVKGLEYSLWDKNAHCRTEGCDGIVSFHGKAGSVFRPLRG